MLGNLQGDLDNDGKNCFGKEKSTDYLSDVRSRKNLEEKIN
jgi:hypothetical protein